MAGNKNYTATCSICKKSSNIEYMKHSRKDTARWQQWLTDGTYTCDECLQRAKTEAIRKREEELGLVIYIGFKSLILDSKLNASATEFVAMAISNAYNAKELLKSHGYVWDTDFFCQKAYDGISAVNTISKELLDRYTPQRIWLKPVTPLMLPLIYKEARSMGAKVVFPHMYEEWANYCGWHNDMPVKDIMEKYVYPVIDKYREPEKKLDKQIYLNNLETIDRELFQLLCKQIVSDSIEKSRIDNLTEPIPPECYPKGKWNGKIYGRFIYLNNIKTPLSDNDIKEILAYQKALAEYISLKGL